MAARESDMVKEKAKMVCVGAIAGAFGVRGEARVKAFTADPFAIGDYGPLSTEDGARNFEFAVSKELKPGVLAGRLSGVETREAAEALRGTRLYVPREALPEPEDEDEFYYADLIGMIVVDLNGDELGKVAAVHDHGAGDLLEIQPTGGGRRPLVPFTREVAPHIDIAGRRITIDPPEGLFDIDAASEAGENQSDAQSGDAA